MKIEKEISYNDADEIESFSETQEDDLFYKMLCGDIITEEIETSRGKFVIKFPKQKDLIAIDRRIAIMRGGIKAESFDDNANFNLHKIALLDVVVIRGEGWFNKLKKENKNFSWSDMPDSNFIDEVYLKAYTFRQKIQEKLAKNEAKTDNKNNEPTDVQESVDDGLFQDITS